MPGPLRHSTGLFTVVTTFTLHHPDRDEEFERHFGHHASWLRAQPGFDSHQAVRLADCPATYVDLSRWRNPESFQRARSSPRFQAHAREFRSLAEVEVDPSRNVLRSGDNDISEGAPALVVEWLVAEGMNLGEFDRAYAAFMTDLCDREGFLHADLTRSLIKPGAYLFVTWWVTADAWRAARRSAPATGAAESAVHLTAVQAAGRAR
ncbi:antibiotic biosynthesis monooxygenase [Streptomyces sp. XD-27]|uniref:antibiotic biosynthesis monooxygenase n=1 Tax=Streptomyces sp. XD-27 TaxID=3062779 RepID=UPI0026F4218E|nr:antibiotic biosynthesis monooxygenase [Streptomyces sp. XD-27]WKX70470.1 antibiotic biosynthesis monooxygenase [Streptomyces sp. XD-27]